jgi:hypothetical protein
MAKTKRTYHFGHKKDKYDHRDFIFKSRAVAAIPEFIDLSAYLPDVRDQGTVGSCVGFGIGSNLSATGAKTSSISEVFSPTWIYNGARFIEGTLAYDDGCYPRDALDWITKKGCLLEKFWPYNPKALDTTSPPSSLDQYAALWPILEYHRVTGGADGIMAALADGHFVSIGTPWYDEWCDPGPGGLLPSIDAGIEPAGGHETLLYGYEALEELFSGLNSWGPDWGDFGRYHMPFSSFPVFNLQGGYDAHVITVNWTEEPPPPPPPAKNKHYVRIAYSTDSKQTWPWKKDFRVPF